MLESIPPAILLLIGALLIGPTRGHWRTLVILVTPLIAFWAIWQVPDGVSLTLPFLGYEIEPIEGSALRRLFASIFAIAAFGGGLFAFRQASWKELAAAYAYAAGAIGVSFAGDLITLFFYWELMALFSTVVVWCGGTAAARAAGIRYAIMHLLGGVILKIGIVGVVIHTGSIDIQAMQATSFGTWMILIGILINAAAPPVSAWLSDAYPSASPIGSVFLSAFTTKTAVLTLILLFPGEPVLIGVGLYMVMYGIIYALLENDIRRILAHSVVSQVGFMVCATGIGTEMALNGAAAHAFAHIIYKALLFMSAGVVVYRTGLTRCTEVGGLFRTMPLTAVCGIIGALSIAGLPLTSGFTTKTMISQAASLDHLTVVYFLLAAASACTFFYAGIKYPWYVFFQRDSGLRPKDAPWNMAIAMVLLSALCLIIGIFPELLYSYLPYPVDYHPYTASKVLFYLQLLLFSGLAFFLLLPHMKQTLTISLDTDWIWRVALNKLAGGALIVLSGFGRDLQEAANARIQTLQYLAQRYLTTSTPFSKLETKGNVAQSIGSSALWIASLLIVYVVVYMI